jgi:hypothetical protein
MERIDDLEVGERDEAKAHPLLELLELRDIVRKYLKDHGLDGLGCEDCSCGIDDLMPCGEPRIDCKAGYLMPCPEDCEFHEDGCDWHIGSWRG